MSQPTRKPESAIEAKIYGESLYDRVTSLLLAVILGAALVFGWLSVIAATTLAYQSRMTRPIEVIEVSGGGGGTPDGELGSKESIEVPGGEVADMASNNEEEASDFEEPSVEVRPAAMLDTVAEAGQDLAEVDVSSVMPRGSRVATGKRRSKIGTGGPGYGFGPGDGGVRREDRWSIQYKTGQTADEYARQLDAFGVELAIVSGNQLIYASNFSEAQPTIRRGSGADDKRLFFVWRGQGRKASDLSLLAKAGLDVGEGVIFQFYPAKVESILEQLEVRYKGRQPAEIRSTRFGVIQSGASYAFEVLAQEPLR
ncbi:hypothetical protein P12x_003822 [Tundrisphaera lichenicola]|uniref:hypothetical protein n=1 Tax=Tundrisphaera lichenicola TaxID=2029860 RepID=UPI003EB8E267